MHQILCSAPSKTSELMLKPCFHPIADLPIAQVWNMTIPPAWKQPTTMINDESTESYHYWMVFLVSDSDVWVPIVENPLHHMPKVSHECIIITHNMAKKLKRWSFLASGVDICVSPRVYMFRHLQFPHDGRATSTCLWGPLSAFQNDFSSVVCDDLLVYPTVNLFQ